MSEAQQQPQRPFLTSNKIIYDSYQLFYNKITQSKTGNC